MPSTKAINKKLDKLEASLPHEDIHDKCVKAVLASMSIPELKLLRAAMIAHQDEQELTPEQAEALQEWERRKNELINSYK